MFRRRTTDAPSALDNGQAETAEEPRPVRASFTPPKGVPTPKRSQAQANRRQPYQAPSDRKVAARESRARDRAERLRRTEASARGEQWALPAKDRGPVRGLARDVVDSRRSLGEYYMFMVVLLIVLLVVPGTTTKLVADIVVVGVLLLIIVEGVFIGTKVKRMAAERYPGESTKGVVMYAAMRGISMRRMRIPKPRVNRGDKI